MTLTDHLSAIDYSFYDAYRNIVSTEWIEMKKVTKKELLQACPEGVYLEFKCNHFFNHFRKSRKLTNIIENK